MTSNVMSRAVARLTASAPRVLGFSLLFAGIGGVAQASVPEIDAGSMSSGLALLAGGLLLLSGRRPRK